MQCGRSFQKEILSSEEFSNSLACFIEMSKCTLSFGNNLLASCSLCTDVRELGSGDWQASQTPTAGPCAAILSPVLAPLPAPGFWTPWAVPGNRVCAGEAAPPGLGPHAARGSHSSLTAVSFCSFFFQNLFSSSPRVTVNPASPFSSSATSTIGGLCIPDVWERKENATQALAQDLLSGHV